jgi:hypothetical protein
MLTRTLVVVALLGGCGKKSNEAPPAAGSASGAPKTVEPAAGSGSAAPAAGSGSAVGSGSDVTAKPTIDAPPASRARPNHDLAKAFGGTAPILPQLSADGESVAASVVQAIGPTGRVRESVAFITAKGKPAMIELKGTGAADVTKRLATGNYSQFEAIADLEGATSPIKHGDVALEITGEGNITLRLVDAKGTELHKETIQISNTCSANPRPDYVWFDTQRKRVLVEVGWELGPHDCNEAPAPKFVLWATP